MVHPVVVIKEPNRTPLYVSIRGPLEIGRECAGVLVLDAMVSRRHLELDVVDGKVVATDLGSSNGTLLDGGTVTSTVGLLEGSVLKMGDVTIELVIDAPPVRQTGTATDAKSTLGPGEAVDPKATFVAGAADRVKPAQVDTAARMTTIDAIASSMTDLDVDAVQSAGSNQGTVTIVFSDIEDSTKRNVAMGDQRWIEVLGIHNDLIRGLLKKYGGTEIKNQGDGFMMSFPGARRALQCMTEVQRELVSLEEQDPDSAVRIRVGLHTGEVVVDDGDLFGTHVVIAARVANLADGREILVSSLTKEIVAARGDVVFGEPREAELKGIGSQLVYPVDINQQLSD